MALSVLFTLEFTNALLINHKEIIIWNYWKKYQNKKENNIWSDYS